MVTDCSTPVTVMPRNPVSGWRDAAAGRARSAGRMTAGAGRAVWAERRQLHRIAWQGSKLLWAVRAAFPWPLRILVAVGCVQIPFLPTDEIAAVVATVWIMARYRRLAVVLWHAAVMEAAR